MAPKSQIRRSLRYLVQPPTWGTAPPPSSGCGSAEERRQCHRRPFEHDREGLPEAAASRLAPQDPLPLHLPGLVGVLTAPKAAGQLIISANPGHGPRHRLPGCELDSTENIRVTSLVPENLQALELQLRPLPSRSLPLVRGLGDSQYLTILGHSVTTSTISTGQPKSPQTESFTGSGFKAPTYLICPGRILRPRTPSSRSHVGKLRLWSQTSAFQRRF